MRGGAAAVAMAATAVMPAMAAVAAAVRGCGGKQKLQQAHALYGRWLNVGERAAYRTARRMCVG